MAQSDAEDRAKEVKAVAERIHDALLRAHRTVYRAAVRSRNDIGTGHPTAADEGETSLGQRLHTDSYRDLVVLGFWYAGQKSPKYVCSTSGMNIVRAVRKAANRTLELANSWRSKDRAGVYHEFLREARRLEPDLREIDPESRRPTNRHEIDMLRLERTVGVAFHVTEAEARMASYLMRHDVAEVVHVYGTDSPCGYCSRTYAVLAAEIEKAARRRRGVHVRHDSGAEWPKGAGDRPPAPPPVIAGLRWRIGWIFYGQLYEAANPEKATDLRALDAAVANGTIAGHRRV
jgi:hypothetical protein